MNELYRYLTLAVSNEWRRQGDRQREEDKAEFAAAVQSTGVAVHAYSLVGTRADADLLLWVIGDELDAIRAWESRCAATRLWAQSSGLRAISRMPYRSRSSRYSGRQRPAWRMYQTGVRSAVSRRHARTRRGGVSGRAPLGS